MPDKQPRRTTTGRSSTRLGAGPDGRPKRHQSAETSALAERADDLRRRVVIEGVRPQVDSGHFPAKATLGESVVVDADVYTDGHEQIDVNLLHRKEGDANWVEIPMRPLGNDRWRAEFDPVDLAKYEFTVEGWVDPFLTWRGDLVKRVDAVQDVGVDLLIGAQIIGDAASRAAKDDAKVLGEVAARLKTKSRAAHMVRLVMDENLGSLMRQYADRSHATRYQRELQVVVDAPRAGFSAWYELFPRSASRKRGAHGTFKDVEALLPYVSGMGFDVLYLPPIHPVGRTKRKGRNNSVKSGPGDPGSPWAIGADEGGHTAIHPDLGTVEDFRRLVKKARQKGIDVALDIAFQCSPDHPWVKEHPEWFRHRPDGTVQYAENPPKKYEDIYPLNFDTPDWASLWYALLSVFQHWIEQGVRIFRVDNPHTKPFRFWEWLIAEVKREHPDVIFLSEAFTRPRIMYHLAKLGFTQSYTYFAWRNEKWDLTEYFTELTQTEVLDFFRPNVWPNTPDILNEHLQYGGRPAFMARVILAATLSSNYGIYGPAYELMESTPREPGSEEYLNSEKYEIKNWDLERPDSLREFIARLNRIRKENPALHWNRTLRFHHLDNNQLIAYSKENGDGRNIIVTVVNLDTSFPQSGWLHLPLEDWGIAADEAYQVHDLLSDARYTWHGPANFVRLDPHVVPAHVFLLRRRGPSEWEFQ